MNLAQATLGGNLTRDPELRYTRNDLAVCSCSIAINEKDGETLFVNVTIWGARGEAFSKYHAKGDPAIVYGRLRLEAWDDKKTGERRTKLALKADGWEFAARPQESPPPVSRSDIEPGDVDDTPF